MDQPVRILIAEDDDADAELVARALRASGLAFESWRVDSEGDFVRALQERDPQLVISDYRMGAFDGRRALQLTQQLHPALPVIVVTGSINEETAVECIKAGAADYVIKEHLARLGPAVRSALESAQLRSDTVRNEERLRQLVRAVEQSPALIVTTDIAGTIEYVNPEFERVTGYSASEAIGLKPSLLKSGLTPTSVYEELWSRIVSGGAWHGDLQNRRKDGSLFWARTRISGVRDPSGRVTHYVSVAEDITGARRAEEALRTTEQQLLLAQKMEAIGRMAGGIAHDFNNLLSVILGHAEQLASNLTERGDLSARARQITWTAEKAASLTRQLLAFSRQQVLAPRVVRLDSVVNDARDMLQRVIGEDVELAVVPAPALGCVKADPGQLVQVLLNLAVNARDAMPHGGRLTVEFEDVQLDEGYVASHPPCLPGPYVMMAVTDTGHGMDAETQRRVFEPFFTTKPEGVGTGLGLSTVYGIIKQSGGFLWVYSEPGVGTSFKAYLPQVDAPEQLEESPEPVRSPAPVASPRSRILLVEDDDGVRELLADILETEGHVVVASALPSDALRLADQHQRFDLLITDVIMPGMSGRELAHLLVERARVVRVLFVSGYAGEALARHGGLERGERFLSKPFSRHTLLDTVRQALAAAEEPPSQ